MIPKIIHHVWINDKPCPIDFKKWTDTWAEVMPDYEIKYWTLDNIPHTPIIDKLLAEKKYWLVINHIFSQILYNEGGFFVSLDMSVIKRFDDLLHEDFVIGRQKDKFLNNAFMAAPPKHQFLKTILEEYNNYDYKDIDKPELKDQIANEIGLHFFTDRQELLHKVFPDDYFFPFHWNEEFTPECITPNTHVIHWWTGSWSDKYSKIKF